MYIKQRIENKHGANTETWKWNFTEGGTKENK